MSKQGNFTKKVLVDWISSECDRQLVNNLGFNNLDWLVNPEILPLKRQRYAVELKLGKDYETLVYDALIRSTALNTKYRSDELNNITKSYATKELLIDIFHNLQEDSVAYLLEHSFPITPSFINEVIFQTSNPPFPNPSSEVIPDILTMQYYQPGEDISEIIMTKDGIQFHNLQSKKIGISIFDIKSSLPDNIGKHHFIEIIYYISSLYHFLQENNLTDMFFITSHKHGILPSYLELFEKIKANTYPNIDSTASFFDLIIEFQPIHYQSVFSSFLQKVRELWDQAPIDKSIITPKITPICSRCTYFDDCKNSLGINYQIPENSKKELIDIRLVPYVQEATVEQLKSQGIDTLSELNSFVNNVQIGNTPSIIYPEIPSLKLKIASLLNQNIQQPKKGEFFSSTIPPFTDISLIINIEKDPILEEVFAFSYKFSIFSGKPEINSWFRIWADYLDDKITLEELILHFMQFHPGIQNIDDFKNNMLPQILSDFSQEDNFVIIHRDNILSSLKKYYDYLLKLHEEGAKILEINNKEKTFYHLSITESYHSEFPHMEFELLTELIDKISNMLNLAVMNEFIIRKLHEEISMTFGIYYWSNEIMKSFGELTEKYLTKLLTHPLTKNQIEFIINWFSPSDSMVSNPIQHRKIFDIRSFVESTFGLPIIINYTWHEIYHELFNKNYTINSRFWNDNFNYMDHDRWHEILNDPISEKKKASMTRELKFKVTAIDQLRRRFQNLSRDILPNSNYPISNEKFLERHIPDSFNPIARIWYLYSRLSGTLQELASNQMVFDIPDFSIAKMNAGKVSNLKMDTISGLRGGKKYSYTFELSGLSTNMKIKKGSWIRLIPYDLRDDYSFLNFRNYLLTVDKKEWSSQKESFIIKTKSTRTQLFDDYKTIIETNRSNQWFVYPKENDNWTNKLYRMRKRKGHEEEDPESFLLRNKIGQSKLGSLVSIKWNIIDTLFQPQFYNSQFLVDLAEVYLFAPHLLEQFQTQQSSFLSDTSPEPNQSQKEAIENSLNQTISAILGPPGTGKSQTIAALLNEYLERSHTNNPDKPVRILITSFSYNAMFVLIDMLETHKNKQDAPSKISKIDRYFVTSNRNNPSCHSIIVDYNTIKIHQIGSDTPQTHLFTDNKTLEDHLPKDFIMFGNAHQLKKLTQLNNNETGMKAFNNDFGFDLIIVDEASQYPTDHILSIFPLIYQNRYQVRVDKELTIQSPSLIGDVEHPDHQFSKLILVGDHNQLPPVQPIKPPKKLENILGSIYSYYVENHKIKQIQLKTNYRSNEVINQITQNLGFYELLDTFENNIGSTISFDYHSDDVLHKTVFDPNIPILSITHNQQYDSTISLIEAELVVSLVIEYFKLINPKNKSEFSEFWASQLGVVVPHNAQSNLIIQKIYSVLEKDVTYITKDELRNTISQSITSVEKFQGSARDMIICSIAISSKDQLRAEEEFIYGLNRFNVISSRARKKFIFICSQNYLNYLPSDQEMMNSISMIKSVIDNLMDKQIMINIKTINSDLEKINIKWKEFN